MNDRIDFNRHLIINDVSRFDYQKIINFIESNKIKYSKYQIFDDKGFKEFLDLKGIQNEN